MSKGIRSKALVKLVDLALILFTGFEILPGMKEFNDLRDDPDLK